MELHDDDCQKKEWKKQAPSLQILIDISEKPKIHAKDVFDIAGRVLFEKAVKHNKIFSIFNNRLQFF